MLVRENSQSARIARLRSRLIASNVAQTGSTLIGAPAQRMTEHDRISLRLGKLTLYEQTPGGVIESAPCGCGAAPASGLCTPTSLNTIAAYLRNYMTEFRNSDFWAYSCDGDGYYIGDGGEDMYDDGNFTTPWLLSGTTYVTDDNSTSDYPSAIQYDTVTQAVVDTDFNYVSLGYVQGEDTDQPQPDDSRHPLTVLGFRCDGPVGWQVGGNLGADGDGSMIDSLLYSGATINGFTVYAYYRQIYDADDPSVCNLMILLGHPSWSSVFGPIASYADSDTGSNGVYFYAGTGSKNILAIHTVLSKAPSGPSDTPIPDSELQTIISKFTQRIGEAMGL